MATQYIATVHAFVKKGNDYWLLKLLIESRPAIISLEVNVALGLRPIIVPYSSDFDGLKVREDGEYYGGSLTTMRRLCSAHGYSLVAISRNGVDPFFVRNELLCPPLVRISPELAQHPMLHATILFR